MHAPIHSQQLLLDRAVYGSSRGLNLHVLYGAFARVLGGVALSRNRDYLVVVVAQPPTIFTASILVDKESGDSGSPLPASRQMRFCITSIVYNFGNLGYKLRTWPLGGTLKLSPWSGLHRGESVRDGHRGRSPLIVVSLRTRLRHHLLIARRYSTIYRLARWL